MGKKALIIYNVVSLKIEVTDIKRAKKAKKMLAISESELYNGVNIK